MRITHQRAIVLLRDAANAGRGTALDLIEQAGARACGKDAVAAGAQKKRPLQGVECAPHGAGRGEGAKIIALAAAGAAVLEHLGKVVIAGQQDLRETFVIAQKHVVARLQALDEIGFKQECFSFRRRGNEHHVRRFGNHARDAVGMLARHGIGVDALFQIARLADVKHAAVACDHAVNAGRIGQSRDQLPDARSTL